VQSRAFKALMSLVVVAFVAVTPSGGPARGAGVGWTYSRISAVPIGTTEAQSVVVHDKLYLFGGFDVWKPCCTPTNRAWVYDPATDHWSALPPMPVRGISHAGMDSDGSRFVYYAGGYAADSAGTNQVYGTTDAFRYDIATGTYDQLPPLPEARAAGGLAYVGGALYYFGGANLARTVDSQDVWELDVANGATQWVARAPMPDPRNHLGWAVVAGQLYAVGGQHFSDSRTAQAELDRYDPGSNTWTRLPGLPVARSHVMDSTFVVGGRLVVASGWTTSSVSAAVTAYDPAAGTWQTWPDLPQARTSATAKSLSDGRFVYCCGSAGTSNSDGWIATPDSAIAAPVATPPVGQPPVAQPTPTPTPAPTPAPTTGPPPAAPPAAAALAKLSLHPSTVRSSRSGAALVRFTVTGKVKVTLVLRRCAAHRCLVVARRTVISPRGPSHVSLRAVTGQRRLPDGHYRMTVSWGGGHAKTLSLLVAG
jgi:N-acetylneuraminic acid mutarotase